MSPELALALVLSAPANQPARSVANDAVSFIIPAPKRIEIPRVPPAPAFRIERVPCGNYVTRISRSFSDGSHEHVCPMCGTSWRHRGGSHWCPGFKEIKVPIKVPVASHPVMKLGNERIGRHLIVCSVDTDRDGSPFLCKACLEMEDVLDNNSFGSGPSFVTTVYKSDWAKFDKWKVDSFPTLILFENGKETRRHVGGMDAAALRRWLDPAVNRSVGMLRLPQTTVALCSPGTA